MHDYVGKKFERDITFQFFIARQPDYSHAALPQNLDQGVAAKNFLSAGKLAQRRIRSGAGRVITHLTSLIAEKTEIKRKPYSDVIPTLTTTIAGALITKIQRKLLWFTVSF